ncbi:MAG: hypothetical protein COB62_01160 [Piscirickettsiaceae bacterium]|nr:MAG: hypothetical protein COB62_01160 [Piscirickettsiaceae bacterium]
MTFNIAFMTIFLGIISSLLAGYMSPYLGPFTEKLFKPLKEKHKEKQVKRQDRIDELASNETLLTLASMNAYFFDLVFFLTFIIYLLVPPISFLNMALSLTFGLLSMVCGYKGSKRHKIVSDALKAYKIKIQLAQPTK